jgi:hypothetical protein
MAVRIESTPIAGPTRKARLLKGLVRHASAPARPQMKLDRVASGEGRRSYSKPNTSLFTRPSSSNLRPSAQPLNELAIAQAVVVRLRLERDEWRAMAQLQERQLLANHREFKRQEQAIAVLKDQNDALRIEHKKDVTLDNQTHARLNASIIKHDKLVTELADSARAAARLKRSDRAKGKVVQRNLRLKATLQRYTSQAATEPDANTETALMEALALANERIEELESRGQNLLEVLDQRNDGPEDSDVANLVEAEGALREVIEDEDFKVQKKHWEDLMQE